VSGVLPGSAVSPFVAEWVPVVAHRLGLPGRRRTALDLAMGEGRHAFVLAEAGFITFGVDLSFERLRAARQTARNRGLTLIQWAADLDSYPLPRARFDLLFCTRFLLRARWAELRDVVVPGGFVLYETFTTGQIAKGIGPTSPDHLLEPGELGRAFAGWGVLVHEAVDDPAAIERIVARKPEAS
jgi:SAM-dependent methyltransferase